MKRVTLLREAFSARGTKGKLILPGDSDDLVSLERPWAHNLPNVSCVPAGLYVLVHEWSPKYKRPMWYLSGGTVCVKKPKPDGVERWGCMFHGANWQWQIHGCIAPGIRWARDRVSPDHGASHSATASQKALAMLEASLEGEAHAELNIRWAP